MKKAIIVILTFLLSAPVAIGANSLYDSTTIETIECVQVADDLDPLVDLSVTVEITQIRTLETSDFGIRPIDKIDLTSDPDFYVKVFINDEEFTSPIWYDTKYIYQPECSATADVPDDVEEVAVTIQLWDASPSGDRLCDISDNYGDFDENYDATLTYNLKTGHWDGDDQLISRWGEVDQSGYGRLNGCDDNSIYQNNRDCELWFDITQTDFDGDGIPYWTEVNVFHTDPAVDNTGEDADDDDIPIEWEWKWGYMLNFDYQNFTMKPDWQYLPTRWEDHGSIDDDNDGLDNIEEYRTSQWGSDPFRDDLFVELDQMDAGPNGQPASIFPEGAKEILYTAYDKHNLVYHLDDGSWENTGSETIPFDAVTTMDWHTSNNELDTIYRNYFLHGDETNWRRGVFHYGVLIYNCSMAPGNAFGSDAYQISFKKLEAKAASPIFKSRDIVYASVYMHECGHTLDLNHAGVDVYDSKYPWQFNFWKWGPYKSCMNYRYCYRLVDYSDGSHGMNDFDDWNQYVDLTYFDTSFY